jgi:16S rRNA G966 N2-methylase RsmD
LLAEGALVYVELPKNGAGAQFPPGWQVQKDKTAGNVRYMLVSAGD